MGSEFDPGPVPYFFMEINHDMTSTVILLPSAESSRVVVSYKPNYVHKVLVNCIVKLALGFSGRFICNKFLVHS